MLLEKFFEIVCHAPSECRGHLQVAHLQAA
jgi:hypothetical protein